MVASSVNYVVVEKISWKHDNSTAAGGKALADLVLADGTKVAGATIASVDNAVTTNYNSGVVEVLTAEVADDYTNNNAYYNRIFTYSVNADGSYDLVKYCDATNVNSHNTGAVIPLPRARPLPLLASRTRLLPTLIPCSLLWIRTAMAITPIIKIVAAN